jgi:hypothetical protein
MKQEHIHKQGDQQVVEEEVELTIERGTMVEAENL